MKYWAFISYSHKDAAIADWLHKRLETYRVPGGLVGTPSRDGTVPERLMPIFRDREELPTSSQLGDNLQRSLEQSRYLVVICSPDGAQSRWVEEEVRAFKKEKGHDRVIALIASGVPNASDGSEPGAECFPHSLRFEGEGKDSTPVRVEPIAADLRPEGDGRERAFLKIVAGLLGVGFDDLYQREKRRQNQRNLLVGTAVAAALVAVAGVYASIRHEIGTVGKDAAVATTDFKDVRPKNKDAEKRIRAAAERAEKVLDRLVEARKNNAPENDYRTAFEDAAKAIVDVSSEAKTAEESIFATELSRRLNARMMIEGAELGKEMTRRADAKIEKAKAQMEAAQRR